MIYINYLVDVVYYMRLMGKPPTSTEYLSYLSDITINSDTGWYWTISHPGFYYWNRVVAVCLGVGTVVFTYLLSRNVTHNRWLGLLGALFLGSLNYHVIESAFVTTDVPVAFLLPLRFSYRYCS
jgi:dolichyl-phosphate-mannose--protein O-mannosyl transferase